MEENKAPEQQSAQQAKKAGYRYVVRQPQFMKYVVANVLSRVGDCIDGIAYMWTIYQMTGSASWSALVFVCNLLPNVIIQPFSGVIIERMNKRSVITLTHILRAGIVGIMLAFYLGGHAAPWLFLAMTFATTVVETFNVPASTAIVPKLVDMEYYEYAVAFDQGAKNAAQLAGAGLAGVIVALIGSAGALMIDAGMFLVAGLILMTIKVKDNAEAVDRGHSRRPAEYLAELKEGFRYIIGKPGIVKLCVLFIITNIFTTPMNALQTPLAAEVYAMGAEFLSLIGITVSAGAVLGSAVYPKLNEKLSLNGIVRYMGIGFAAIMVLIPLAKLFNTYKLLAAVYGGVVTFGLGFFSSIVITAGNVQIVKSCEEQYLSRSMSLFHSATACSAPLAALVISGLATGISTFSIFLVCGAAMTLMYLFILIRNPDFMR